MFLVKKLATNPLVGGVKIYARTAEKLIAIDTKHFTFIDSLAHMNASLDTISQNLIKHGKDHFKILRSIFPDDAQFNLMLGKGSFCYEYLDSVERLSEPCPPHSAFYSSLKQQNITTMEYENVINIFQSFKLQNIGDLMKLYCIQDVAILADCFNEYRQMVRKSFDLEAAAYFSSPSLTLDAALKFTNVTLELIQDVNKYMFIESGIRGGLAIANTHYAKANNPRLPDYNPQERDSSIFYIDVTNLYGYNLSQQLPTSNFEWETLTLAEVIKIAENYNHTLDKKGYIVEVDMTHPVKQHDRYSDFPPVISKLTITEEMLSPWGKLLLGDKKHCPFEKLAPNFLDKK
jgi:hypothetical protein